MMTSWTSGCRFLMSQSGKEAGSHSGRLGASWTADICWASVATSLTASSDTLEAPCEGSQYRGKTRPAERRRDGDAKFLRSVSGHRRRRLVLCFGRRLQDGCAELSAAGPHICSLIIIGRLVPLSNTEGHENACMNHTVKTEQARSQLSGSAGVITQYQQDIPPKSNGPHSKNIEWHTCD
jgi:hypothetical protein